MIEKFDSEELDSWRLHPVTKALSRELELKLKRREHDLFHAGVTNTIETIRRLAGEIVAFREVQDLIDAQGVDE